MPTPKKPWSPSYPTKKATAASIINDSHCSMLSSCSQPKPLQSAVVQPAEPAAAPTNNSNHWPAMNADK